MSLGIRIVAAAAALAAPALAVAQSGTVTALSARTDVMKAGGNASGSDGLSPLAIALTAGTGRVLQVSDVTGSVGCAGSTGFNADGVNSGGSPCVNQANVTSAGGISGIQLDGRSVALIGVFLSGSVPASAPARLGYGGAGLSYTASSFGPPLIGQTFYIGDGLTGTGTGTLQSFLVPDAATALYFGFVDANGYQGSPNFFGDNVGSLDLRYSVAPAATSTVPEPSTYALLATGLVTLAGVARRRRTA